MIASFNMLVLPGKNCTFCLLATTTLRLILRTNFFLKSCKNYCCYGEDSGMCNNVLISLAKTLKVATLVKCVLHWSFLICDPSVTSVYVCCSVIKLIGERAQVGPSFG